MKRCLGFLVASLATPAFARSEPQLEIQQTVYSYTKSTVSEKPEEGESSTSESDGFQSMPSDLEINAAVGKWIFTVAPTAPGEAFEVSYGLTKTFELGLDLAYNHSKDDTDGVVTTKNDFLIGPRAQYDLWLGDDTLEFEMRLGLGRASSTIESEASSTTPASTSSTKESTYEAEIAVMGEHVVNDNLRVAAGIGYTYGNGRETVEKLTSTSGELEIWLLQFRYGFY